MFFRYNLLYPLIIILSSVCLISLILPSFAQEKALRAQEKALRAPETMEEVKEMGIRAGEVMKKEMPGTIEKIWKEEVIPVWKSMWEWGKKIWDTFIWPIIKRPWQKFKSLIGKEIEKRKPIIKEEFKKEKEEMKKSIWERFKELIK